MVQRSYDRYSCNGGHPISGYFKDRLAGISCYRLYLPDIVCPDNCRFQQILLRAEKTFHKSPGLVLPFELCFQFRFIIDPSMVVHRHRLACNLDALLVYPAEDKKIIGYRRLSVYLE